MNKTLTKRLARALGTLILAFAMTTPSWAQETNRYIIHIHNDALGNPIAASDPNGEIVWRRSYGPFGEFLENGPQDDDIDIGYTGREFDNVTGLSFMGARDYDPEIGRFYSMDPVGFREDNVHSFNRYAYANNNPYAYVDRDGEYADLILESVSIGLGFNNAVRNFSQGNVSAGIVDSLGVLGDTFLAVIPIAPGVIGLSRSVTNGGLDAANRLGVNLDDVPINNGVAQARMNVSSSLESRDINQLKDVLRSRGATRAEVETGFIANEKLDGFLRRRVQDGKPFHGGTVRISNSANSDFTIDFDL